MDVHKKNQSVDLPSLRRGELSISYPCAPLKGLRGKAHGIISGQIDCPDSSSSSSFHFYETLGVHGHAPLATVKKRLPKGKGQSMSETGDIGGDSDST
jgi:hypothetical protein